MHLEQAKDTLCAQIRAEIDAEKNNMFIDDDHDVLIRIASVDAVHQIVVQEPLRQKILLLAHYMRLSGQSGMKKSTTC